MANKKGRKRKRPNLQGFKKGNGWRKRSCNTSDEDDEDEPPQKIIRPSKSVLGACKDQNVRSPMILRPRNKKKEERQEDTCNTEENILLNIQCVPTLSTAILDHGWSCKNPNINATIDRRDGIAVYVTLSCSNCRYKHTFV